MENVAAKRVLLASQQNIAIEMRARIERREKYRKSIQPRKIEQDNTNSIHYCKSMDDLSYRGAQRIMRII